MFSRCDNDNKRPGPLEAEVIPVLHSVVEANASDESGGVAQQEDEQIGIFQVLDKLEEAVDALLNTSSSLSHPQLEVKTNQIKSHQIKPTSRLGGGGYYRNLIIYRSVPSCTFIGFS
jgi:hypothetical protein